MDSTVLNPSIPYIGQLPIPLNTGSLLRISGTVPSSATCFSVNLQNGSSTEPRSDIALHLSPVFSPPPRIVRNSLETLNWGPEESHGSHFPLSLGQGFEVLILADTDHFKIAVNGQHFTEFQYRLPLQSISYLTIDGDVIINAIKFENTTKSSVSAPSEEIVMPLGFIDPNAQYNPSGAQRPPSPYNPSASLPYPANATFGPSPSSSYPTSPSDPYGPPQMTNPYGPPQSNPYGPPSNQYGPPTSNQYGPPISNQYGPPPSNQYGPSPYYPQGGDQHYPSQGNPYGPQGYPQQHGNYPQGQYPSQPGPYPGTSVVYPGQEKAKDGSGMNFGPLAAAGAAIAGAAGTALLSGKKHKKKKHGLMSGGGPASLLGGPGALLGGVGSLMGPKKPGHHGGSAIPGGALAGGAAALAGAYMLSKSPIGKVMKPKKMKKMYKHKGWGSSSSSSSSSD